MARRLFVDRLWPPSATDGAVGEHKLYVHLLLGTRGCLGLGLVLFLVGREVPRPVQQAAA